MKLEPYWLWRVRLALAESWTGIFPSIVYGIATGLAAAWFCYWCDHHKP